MAKKPSYEELEQKIEELTAEIVKANELLKNEKDGRKRTEERLEVIESIINRGPAVLFLWGVKPGVWPVKHVSKNIKKILGYSVDDFLSGRISWPGITHPDDVPRLEAENARYFAEGIKEWSQEYRLLTKSGDIRWMKDWNLVLVDSVGESTGLQAIAIDITDLKQVEESLRESEEKYRSLVDSTKDSIYLLDRNCTYLFMNKEHLSRLGLTAKKAIGRTYAEFHSEDASKDFAEKVEKVFKTGKSISYEYRSQRDDEYFIRTLSPVKDLDGRTVSITVVSKDITERKKAEEELRESEERLKIAGKVAYDLIYEWTVEDDELEWFGNIDEMLGYKPKEIPRTIDGWVRIIHPEDIVRLKDAVEEHRTSTAPISYEYRVKHKNGSWRYWNDHGMPMLNYEGLPYKWIGVCTDITERKQAEEQLQKLALVVKYSSELVNLATLEGKMTFLNEAGSKMLGIGLDEVERVNIMEVIPDHLKELVQNELLPTLKQGKMWEGELQYRNIKTGELTDVHAMTFTVQEPNTGKPLFLANVSMDITDRKKAEEEKAKFQAQLHQAQKMETIGIFAGGVAHDLNNILSGIISYPELLLLDLPEGSPLRKPLLTIKSSGEKAAVVVQDLLTLARRGVTITEIVNLNSIISEQLKSPEFENLKSFHSNVDIKTNLEKDLLNIKGSTAHLGKTVMNLVSNAAEAMPDGGKVLVSTENLYIDRPIRGYDHVDEGDYVVVKVSDTGIGISKKDMNRIFEPFYTKKVMGRSGTGLGMAVVWGTVKDHNGYIDVESTKGKGTTFTLYFPIIRQEIAIDKSLISIEDYMGKGESILIIDDVEEQREIASGMLKKLGYSVTSVSSGEEAIEYM